MFFSRPWRRSYRGNRQSFRKLFLEGLETRALMAADTYMDPFGNQIGFIPAPPAIGGASGGSSSGNGYAGDGPQGFVPLDDTFKLHSRPSATKTVYLDFDGFTARGTPWNAGRGRDPIISPAYDLDGNGAAFTDRELRAVQPGALAPLKHSRGVRPRPQRAPNVESSQLHACPCPRLATLDHSRGVRVPSGLAWSFHA